MKSNKNKAKKAAIVYRKAKPDDAFLLSILFRQVYIFTYATDGIGPLLSHFMVKQFEVETIRKKITSNPNCMILATYNENLVGVAEIDFHKKCPLGDLVCPELNKLYVYEHFTGLGIGYQLLKEVENCLLELGFNELWLWVYAINDRACDFYQRQNYSYLGNASFQIEDSYFENKVLYKKLKNEA